LSDIFVSPESSIGSVGWGLETDFPVSVLMLVLLDAPRIPAVSEAAVNLALSTGPCIIVGRGSQYFLRNRKDVFRTFLYASRDYKIHRLVSAERPNAMQSNRSTPSIEIAPHSFPDARL